MSILTSLDLCFITRDKLGEWKVVNKFDRTNFYIKRVGSTRLGWWKVSD